VDCDQLRHALAVGQRVGVELDESLVALVLQTFLEGGQSTSASKFVDGLEAEGKPLTVKTARSVVMAMIKRNMSSSAILSFIRTFLPSRGIEPDAFCYTALIQSK